MCRASSLDDEIIYYDINIYYTGPLPLALNSYFIGIDIFIYSIYPVWYIAWWVAVMGVSFILMIWMYFLFWYIYFLNFFCNWSVAIKGNIKIRGKISIDWAEQGFIGVTRSDTSVTMICHVVSLTVLWLDNQSIDIVKLFLAELNHILQVTNGHKNL